MSVDGQSRYEVGMRLKNKIAIVVGAGQSQGEGLGNGRATVLRLAREGANVLAVDNNLASAEETVAMARQSGGECLAFEADVANETTLAAMVEAARRRWGRNRCPPLQCRREHRWRGRTACRDHRGFIRSPRHHQPV
jgi:NAD(P)-dependent dehydrogenase (short-subunit alcohol dehydrogenase family)